MNTHELIGEIYPWPGSQLKLPEGWSWGPNEQIAKIQTHKSRLIMQADALATLRDPTIAEKILKHALYSGAAEWELWLLENGDQNLKHELKSCAHSAVSLAKLSGDVPLVVRILEAWEKRGTPRSVFANEATKWVKTNTPLYDARMTMLRDKYGPSVLEDLHDPQNAKRVLEWTNLYADHGGPAELVATRAMALETLNQPVDEIVDARFTFCVGRPTNPRAALALLLAARRLHGERRLPTNLFEAGKWFHDSLVLQTGLLDLAQESDTSGLLGLPTLVQEKTVEQLALHPPTNVSLFDIEWAFATCAKVLAHNGELENAHTLLSTAVEKHPHVMNLRVLRAYEACKLGYPTALNELKEMLADTTLIALPVFWQVVGEVFIAAAEWSDATRAFRRGGLDESTFGDASRLNQYAVALAQSGDVSTAKNVLKRSLAIAPEDVLVRQNLTALEQGAAVAAIVPQPLADPFATLFLPVANSTALPWDAAHAA